ncbi:MAG: hypothetical protein V3U26_07150 [Dehalococcoidia bacterium]
MITKYSLVVDPALSSLFREAFNTVAERRGFATVLKLAAPGTGVWEYQRQEIIISLHTFSVEEAKERLVIETKSYDLAPLIAAVLSRLTTDLLATFLEPIRTVRRREIEQKLKELLSEPKSTRGRAKG